MRKKKEYIIEVSQTWPDRFVVSATSAKEAENIAWERYKPKRTNHKIISDRV